MQVGQDNELDVAIDPQAQAIAGIEQRLGQRPLVPVPGRLQLNRPARLQDHGQGSRRRAGRWWVGGIEVAHLAEDTPAD